MLGALRKRKNSPIITFLLGLTALLMIGFGVSLQGLSSASAVAHVNGEPISELDFNARYTVTFREKQNQDRRYDRTRAEKEGLREQVLNGMMTGKILSQKGAAMGLAIDDSALRSALVNDRRFQTEDGRFDKVLYQRTLAFLRTTDRRFESQYRDELLAKPLTSILPTVAPSEAEIRARFERDENKVNVSFIQVLKADFAAQAGEVTPTDIEQWKAETPDPDAAVEAYYARNKQKKYDVPKRVCARQILVRSPKQAPPDQRTAHQAKIKKALDALNGGEDFAKVVEKFSEGSAAKNSGDMGCFGPGQMLPALEQAAFGLESGQHSGILKTNFGYHVIQVSKVEPPIRKKLEEVKDEIVATLAKSIRVRNLAKAQADRLHEKAKEAKDLAEALKAAEVKDDAYTAAETGPFIRSQTFLGPLGSAAKVAAAAWTLTDEAPMPDGPVETERAWVVMRLKERITPDDSTYDQKRKFIAFQLTREKQELILDKWFRALRENADTSFDPVVIRYDDEAQAIRQARRRM